MTFVIPQCSRCRHFHDDNVKGNFCDAFPESPGIPKAIILNEITHDHPVAGDHGVQFEPKNDASKELLT